MKKIICKDTGETAKTYAEYLKTDHWKRIKEWMYKTFPYECKCCGKRSILTVHHLTYVRVGNEKLTDLVYLCDHCHKQVHAGVLNVNQNTKLKTHRNKSHKHGAKKHKQKKIC